MTSGYDSSLSTPLVGSEVYAELLSQVIGCRHEVCHLHKFRIPFIFYSYWSIHVYSSEKSLVLQTGVMPVDIFALNLSQPDGVLSDLRL